MAEWSMAHAWNALPPSAVKLLRELAGQLLIQPPHGRLPLRAVSQHFFVLGPSNGRNRLIFRCAACDLCLNGVSHIHQHLPEAAEPLSSFSRVCRDRSVSRHENIGAERFDRIQCAQPVETVPVVDEQELVRKKELAQISDAILRNEDNAVASRVRTAYVEYLALLAAQIERHAVSKRLIRES